MRIATLAFALICSVGVPGLAAQARPPFDSADSTRRLSVAQDRPLDAALGQAQAGQYQEAVATLEAAIRTNPKGGDTLYLLLADCHTQLADPAKAEAALRAGLRAYPAAPILERALGQLLFRARVDSSEAGTLLARAAKMMPRDPQARHYYAQWAYLNARERICVDQERAALALPGLNDLAALQMNTLLGMCYSRLLQEEEAAQGARLAFQRANEINARQAAYDPIAAFQYVQFLARYGDDAAAQAIADEILQRVPRFGPARLEKAKSYDRGGDCARAIAEAKLALSSDGNDINSERAAHILMARCYSLLGNADEAAKEQQWIEAHPNPETPRKPPPRQ
jgi:tetratricopeptide (TPR) repeat protein